MSVLDALAPYKLVAEIVVIGSLAGGALYGFSWFCNHLREEGRQEVRAEDARLAAAQNEANRKYEGLLSDQVIKAQNDANQRQQTIDALVAGNARSLSGLQRTVGALGAGQPGQNTVEALGKANAALSSVFLDCAGRYVEMAKTADGHASDVKTVLDAWPVAQPQPPQEK